MRLEELWGQTSWPSQGKSEAPVVTGVSPVLREECRRHGGYYRKKEYRVSMGMKCGKN